MTIVGCAVNAQQISANAKDRYKSVGAMFGCHGEGKRGV